MIISAYCVILALMFTVTVVFLGSLAATLLSVMSGGGAAIITLPIFLWAGISLPVSVAATKICALFWTPLSAYNYLKRRRIDWLFLLLFSALGLAGAYAGVQFVVDVNEDLLKPVIGGLIIALVVFSFFNKQLGSARHQATSGLKRFIAYPAALAMGFYESILGSGNGIIFAALTCHTRGFDFITALGYYFGIAFFWVGFAALLYVQKGYYDIPIMAAASLGSIIGGYAGSRYARYRGNRFTKRVFITVGLILGIKMILGI